MSMFYSSMSLEQRIQTLLERIEVLEAGGGGGTGFELLDSNTVSGDPAYVGFDLPVGYDVFQVMLSGLVVIDSDPGEEEVAHHAALVSAISADGGTTFYCDNSNFDTYSTFGIANQSDTPVALCQDPYDGLPYLTNFANDQAGSITDGLLTIWPGSISQTHRIMSAASCIAPDGLASPGSGINLQMNILNPNATTPPIFARANHLRIQPLGNMDFPPTSVMKLSAGTIHLFGLPSA